MKKRQFLGIFIPLIILAVLVALIVVMKSGEGAKSDTSGNLSSVPMAEFGIKDTGSVDQVIITEANGVSIIVQRRMNPDQWKLDNGEFNARYDAIQLILETAFRIKVKQEVDKKGVSNVITQIAARNKKVEFFKDGEDNPFKTYYVGSPTPDKLGTYMLLKVKDEKAKKPYIMHKPGMYGNLESRFFADKTEWRSTSVFKYGRGDIAKVHLQFYEEPQSSHVVMVAENGDLTLQDFSGAEVTNYDKSSVQRYVTLLQSLNYEGFNNELNLKQADSVRKATPFYTLAVTNRDGVETKVVLHRKNAPGGLLDYKGDPILWDKDRYWGNFAESPELMKLQSFSWGPVFKPIQFFTKK
jgi:hypothetical protein